MSSERGYDTTFYRTPYSRRLRLNGRSPASYSSRSAPASVVHIRAPLILFAAILHLESRIPWISEGLFPSHHRCSRLLTAARWNDQTVQLPTQMLARSHRGFRCLFVSASRLSILMCLVSCTNSIVSIFAHVDSRHILEVQERCRPFDSMKNRIQCPPRRDHQLLSTSKTRPTQLWISPTAGLRHGFKSWELSSSYSTAGVQMTVISVFQYVLNQRLQGPCEQLRSVRDDIPDGDAQGQLSVRYRMDWEHTVFHPAPSREHHGTGSR